ncbi:N-acetylglucosaminyldiphosphoundecaprenol N-acetyl-beta-D-mannosaminyltransferase [Rubrivivax gelatinosus]|uniref:WecB/TagA/CpsF family glycosyltransferase n=1 Tax=Rubrivivax gelatinosus TaxID=28068 RepID=UPI00031F726C|nr:WecB/TagA/CpsF family glycosyltransferase [Rubrivivax gelatinosus]MBG6081032.1 N-acetylglucosaminyldiphosphoundecaprenol N-acetyl-beta-D-mannosaminyltransferase [Rubrivivax gelatinosus]
MPIELTSACTPRVTAPVLGTPIDALDWDRALGTIAAWSARRESRVICICNAHSVVTAAQEPDFAAVLASADMATPDGAPVAWMLRRLGHDGQQRINGPDLMWRWCAEAARRGDAIFLFGSTPETLARLAQRLLATWPALRIAGSLSPPFRALTPAEDAEIVERINASGAGVVFVSLGCPKQERWMAAHRGAVQGVMIGVGAAFDFHAGTIQRAPGWMRNAGLEWLHRLLSEPRRLWRRYLFTNSAFTIGAARQLLGSRRSPR